MAVINEPTKAQLRAWRKWVAERPPSVRKIAEGLTPWTLYRMKSTGHRCTVLSISEGGTVTVAITGEFNLVTFERKVFGIDPSDLEECDLPADDEIVGSFLTHDEVEDNLDAMRVMVRPDLWYLDENGKAVRRH